jgi:hypothetical protein
MKVKYVDIRFNLEFIGLKEGTKAFSMDARKRALRDMTTEKILNAISTNSCILKLDDRLNKRCVNGGSGKRCRECWNEEVK